MQRILGQERPLRTLRRALQSGRIHHAWIFAGPRGVGKFTTAAAFAKVLLDPDAGPNLAGEIEADPDGRIAHLVDAGTHPDFHVVRKELALVSENPGLRRKKLSNIPLDVLREWMIGGKTSDDRYHEGSAYRTPALGHGKVFVIDEAELIDQYGQNALLKTLEEPPPRTYLILVTAQPGRLLPTIRSRCQLVTFERLDETAMRTWLERDGLEIGEAERDWILSYADGAPGIARLAVEYGFHRWRQTLEPMLAALARGDYPADMGPSLFEMIEEFALAWVKANKNASKDAANKDGARHVFSLLAAHARNRLARACDAGEDPSPHLPTIDLIRAAEVQLYRNVNVKQVLENLVVQWSRAGAATLLPSG